MNLQTKAEKFLEPYLKQIKINKQNKILFIDVLCSKETPQKTAKIYIKDWVTYNIHYDNYIDILNKSLALGCAPSLEKSIYKYGDVEGNKRYNLYKEKLNTASLESKIRRYGEVEGRKKFKEYCDRQAYTNSKEYKGMSDSEFKVYNNSRAVTEKNLIKKHGKEKGIKKFQEYCDRQAYTNSEEYYIEKYGAELGKEKYLKYNRMKAHSLENYVNRYGKELGKEKYKSYCENTLAKKSFSSIIANDFFDIIDEGVKYKSYYARKGKEFGKYNNNLERYTFFDYVIPELKFCIEFNGDVFHGNPKLYEADDYPNPFEKTLKASNIWKTDKIKEYELIKEGYVIIHIWELDYNTNKEKVIENTINKLKEINAYN